MKRLHYPVLLAAAIFAAAWQAPTGAQTTVDQTLPDLGEPADVALSPAQGITIGKQIVGEMYRYNYIVDDPELSTYINSIGWRLAQHGSKRPPDFHFFPIADNGINAFALPGANIGINVGTLVAADNEDELAAVIAHEEAHVTQRHLARAANQSPIEGLATWAAIIAAMIASAGNPNAVIGGLMAGQSLSAQREINYTRSHEMEADRVGIRTLANAGYDPNAMASFFSRLQQQARLYGNMPQLLLDHPVNTARMAEATERAKEYPPVKPAYSLAFHLMRARGRVLETDLPADALKYFTAELGAGHETPGNRYGLAMTLHTMAHNAQALDALQPLLEKWPDQRDILLLKAAILDGMGKTAEAVVIARKVLDANPNYAPAILRTASDLITLGKPRQAREILLGHSQSYGTDPQTWELLARAALAMHDEGEAAFQMANYYEARRNPRQALDQIDAGLRLKQLSSDDRARLRARREALMASIPRKTPNQRDNGLAGRP